MRKLLVSLLLLSGSILQCAWAQNADFVRGADVSWCTEMEAAGKCFYDAQGSETELMALMHQIGMTAVRLRVWVNPEQAYGAWSDKADVLAKARRAHAAGLEVMIDFHYSDFFADPGRQTKPAAWASYTAEQLKNAVAGHTKEVLQALKAEGIEPRWVQVGNETRPGMIFDEGKIDWSKSGAAAWAGYVALSNAGYDAVKAVLPQAQVIVHIDKGPDDNAWFFRDFKKYGGKFDMIGLSHYPESAWQNENSKTADNAQSLATQFAVPVMIVETGYACTNEALAGQVMADFMAKAKAAKGCAGVFYWEPEVYGWWKPSYYNKVGWNAYNKGAFTSQGRPAPALDAFAGDGTKVQAPSANSAKDRNTYDLSGRRASSSARGILVTNGRKVIR